MKFIHYLEKITSVSIYGVAAFVIFASFFIGMLIWALKADKNMIEEIKQIPLNL